MGSPTLLQFLNLSICRLTNSSGFFFFQSHCTSKQNTMTTCPAQEAGNTEYCWLGWVRLGTGTGRCCNCLALPSCLPPWASSSSGICPLLLPGPAGQLRGTWHIPLAEKTSGCRYWPKDSRWKKKYADGLSRGLEKSKKWIIQTHHLECKSTCSGSQLCPCGPAWPSHCLGPPAVCLQAVV